MKNTLRMERNKTGVSALETLHIGQCIKAELARQGRTITWLAGEVHCTRENLYKMFRKTWINTDVLFRVSRALDHNFFKDYSDFFVRVRDEEKK